MQFGRAHKRCVQQQKRRYQHAHLRVRLCHAECKKMSLDSVVCPPKQLRAVILAETVLAGASATLSAGEGCAGIKTLSTQKVATAHASVQQDQNR